MSGELNPYDGLVRRAWSVPAYAASQVRTALPAEVIKRLDLGDLVRQPADFVDVKLRSRYSDVLYSVSLDGRDAFIYVLLEHQSSTDRWMPLRMLEYVVRIWSHHLTRNPGADRAPAVIPIVVHHNTSAWSGATELADLIDLDADTAELLGEYLPRFRFLLDDLGVIDDQQLRERPLAPGLRLTYVLLRATRGDGHADLPDQLWPWTDQALAMLDEPGGYEMLQAQLQYIREVTETPDEQLHEWFDRLGPEAKEMLMTTAEKLRAEGHATGHAEGRAETLLQQMEIRFGPLSQATADTVRNATPEQLEAWTSSILIADSLDDVLS